MEGDTNVRGCDMWVCYLVAAVVDRSGEVVGGKMRDVVVA